MDLENGRFWLIYYPEKEATNRRFDVEAGVLPCDVTGTVAAISDSIGFNSRVRSVNERLRYEDKGLEDGDPYWNNENQFAGRVPWNVRNASRKAIEKMKKDTEETIGSRCIEFNAMKDAFASWHTAADRDQRSIRKPPKWAANTSAKDSWPNLIHLFRKSEIHPDQIIQACE